MTTNNDDAGERFKVCPECGTEATRIPGRRRDARYWWWCWRCAKGVQPACGHWRYR